MINSNEDSPDLILPIMNSPIDKHATVTPSSEEIPNLVNSRNKLKLKMTERKTKIKTKKGGSLFERSISVILN